MFSSAEGALLTPVVFFDLFDKPLRQADLPALAHGVVLDPPLVETLVGNLVSRGVLARAGEYLTLPGREAIADAWFERELTQRLLWAEAEAVVSCLAAVPFVRLVAVSNSLALGTATAESDIDLVVVVEPGGLAVARDHLLARLEVLGRRAHRLPKRGKAFPDVMLTTERLELAAWQLEPLDIYLDYWLMSLQPLIDRGNAYRQLVAANGWLAQTFPGWQPQQSRLITPDPVREAHRSSWERWYRSAPGRLMGAGQTLWYAQRMLRYQAKLRERATVVAQADLLRIHEPDKRPQYQQAFAAAWQRLERIAA